MSAPHLKTLLAAGNALLEPPSPLPSAPPALLARLKAAGDLLPWRDRPGWSDDDELEAVGDDGDDPVKRKARRDALVMLVGQRALDLLVAMQGVLAKEFWPAEHKDGMGEKDFLLGTADQRLLRLLLQHALVSYLLPLVLAYVAGLRERKAVDPCLSEAVSTFLGLTDTPSPPSGGSTRIPHTSITQSILSSHLPPLMLAGIVVGWTPSAPPATYSALRAQLLHTLSELSPTQAMGALSTALKIVGAGKTRPPKGWTRTWPAYVEGTLGTLLSNQVLRPGGVKAVMENVFGEVGNMAGEGVDGPKLDRIAGLLSRVPRSSSPETYIPYLLETLFGLMGEAAAPVVYSHTAAYVVHHLWANSPVAVTWLKAHLHEPWNPAPREGVVLRAEGVQSLVGATAQLVLHAPPSPDFVNFVVGPILPQIFALYVFLKPQPTTMKAKEKEGGLAADTDLVLTSWGKLVGKDDGVKGVWSIITTGRGWSVSEHGEVLHFQRVGDGAELVYGYPHTEESLKTEADSMEVDDQLGDLDLAPDPLVLADLLKKLGRADMSSEVFLRVLNEWRVRASSDGDPLKSLLFLRLTLVMMETLGNKVLAEPGHVLAFVEGVLNDEATALPDKKPFVQEVGDEVEIPELTEDSVEQLGLLETAISLLLATLEDESITFATYPILHPIASHLTTLESAPSAHVRQLAREATLVLLVRRSASLTAGGKVSESVSTYRRALGLIADPILPVRAHGLVLLRELVFKPDYDTALTPAILDVYMQALQDADSYIYLNAAKGLAAMADALGKEILRTLCRVYSDTAETMDKRLRIGEALEMIIKRAGKAFAANVGLVIPPLTGVFRDAAAPTVLRTSALSLLSTAAEEDHLALLPWAAELASAAVDLVQVESVTSSAFRPAKPESEPKPRPKVMLIDDEEPEPEPALEEKLRVIDEDPVTANPKHPALRRAALVFLGLLAASLIEATQSQQDPSGAEEFKLRLPGQIHPETKKDLSLDKRVLDRTVTVLRYVAGTDVDEVVRGQAGEVVALVERLRTLEGLREVGRASSGREFLA
ncbi:hypothetical protein CC85DRAFT_257343 [Cutaneotrichosporon oleaginosum]|uniref:RNA polymerase II assembly factor Rtp1 C-terminal domain-containing protein n=1 Tax=Cutaneotrichosporon oleaginosum TaxID=879819 RepID=A0A0J0XT42_9TREE|nr:uncharacterized protein CC85DRAFT_257343 [Cutaneotrichosporon oleaginosum]KLT44246.1 hypothetical protein CC85DRAFT_257343 [Cutaneotrichosporon oleaginosum]TXT11586.1 hypothetical protein COLE_01996 [Cutaneotrichosporon oleaginosum]